MKFWIVNGVNLALTGSREVEVYGSQSLAEINDEIARFAREHGHEVEFFQSDLEGELCKKIGSAKDCNGIVLNAGAYSHYSLALRDAIAATSVPVVEVHMSNIAARESFRRNSVLSEVCKGTIFGFGKKVYFLALESFWL